MKDEDLLRYSRQIALPEIDISGQSKIFQSKVIIIGLGGLGTVVASYLCRMGIGEITVCDYDKIDISNLHRQILYNSNDLGSQKAKKTQDNLNLINPGIIIKAIEKPLSKPSLDKLVTDQDVVVDATDNFKSRYLINEVCWKNKKTLVSGSAIGWKGQLLVLDFNKNSSPCYECLYGHELKEDDSCSELGIIPPIAGVVGSLQALETIKLVLEEEGSFSFLTEFNGLTNDIRRIRLKSDPKCKICS